MYICNSEIAFLMFPPHVSVIKLMTVVNLLVGNLWISTTLFSAFFMQPSGTILNLNIVFYNVILSFLQKDVNKN